MRLLPLFIALSPLVIAAKQPVTMADLLKIRRVTSVEVTPSGSHAIFGVQSIETKTVSGDPQYRAHLFSIDLNDTTGKPVQLTHGLRNDNGIAISPDGRQFAFLRTEDGKAQVWLMPLGMPGEAHSIGKFENGARTVKWRPDGKALLVTSPIPVSKIEGKPHFPLDRPRRDWNDTDKKDARPDGDLREVRNWLDKNAAKSDPTAITRINFLDEQGLEPEMSISQLFLLDSETGKSTQLTKDFYNHRDAVWSSDGKQIAFVSTPPVNVHPDRLSRSSIWTMNADGSDIHTSMDDELWTYGSPRYSEDGKSLYFTATETADQFFRQSKLAKIDLASKSQQWLASEWQSTVQPIDASGGSVYFTSSWQGGSPLHRVNADGKLEALVQGPVGVSAFDIAAGRIVYAEISVANPNELFLLDRNGKRRQLTSLNSDWLADKEIVQPEEHWITRPDGFKVQYWIMKPSGFDATKKYPVVLDMHGGPSAMWGPGELSMWHEFQIFCSWGYGVVYSNPRGSSGYGYEFQKANFKNWGDGPAADVLAAFDESVKNNPWIDTEREFITGGSYAGYLTAWIIGHDHRFKAAAAQRGVYELSTFFGEGNAFRLVPNHFGGYPWDPETRRILDQQSPFTHVAKIKTPFLILHGSQDLRTGVTQSEMMFKALAQLGKQVEYIRYPNVGHEQTRSGPPVQRMDHMLRILEFFERYAKNDRPVPAAKIEVQP